MAVFASPPLLSVSPAFITSSKRVATCLDAPLAARGVDARELLCLAAVLDVAAERAARVPGAVLTPQHREKLARVERACRALAPRQPAARTLEELGLAELYPALAALVRGEQQSQQQQQPGSSSSGGSSSGSSGASLAAHLGYVSLLNQVVMMGTQLYNDAVAPSRHKYAAHQVALLYQSLNMLQGETKPIRRLIEARFDEVKAITEGPRPTLPADVGAWLQQVTWVCREEVAACPGYAHRRLAPLPRALERVGAAARTARCSSCAGSPVSVARRASEQPSPQQPQQQMHSQQQWQHAAVPPAAQQQQQWQPDGAVASPSQPWQPQSCHEQLQQQQQHFFTPHAAAACS